VVSQAASLEVFQVVSQVGEDSQVGGNSHNSHSQRQDGLASSHSQDGQARLLSSHSHSLSSHNLSNLSSLSNLHHHRHSQLLLRLRDPQ